MVTPEQELEPPATPSPAIVRVGRHGAVLAGTGLLLLGCAVAITRLSPRFEYGGDPLERPIPLLVTLLVSAGMVYLVAVASLLKVRYDGKLLGWVIGVGVALRVTMMLSTPILEDDYYRYLWDGALTANGYNPYAYTPQDIVWGTGEAVIPPTLKELAEESGRVVDRVNHPHLGTIYPPMAQGAFVLAHWIAPWSLAAWRIVLLGFDLAVLGLVLLLLRRLGKPLHHAAIYWWNPLVVKELFNSSHMDAVVLPFVLAALFFTIANRPLRAGATLALGIGAKAWPVMVAPVLLRAVQASPRRMAIAVVFSALILAVIFLPLASSLALGKESGFSAYAQAWEMNDALFMVFHKGTQIVSWILGMDSEGRGVDQAARAIVFGVLVLWTAWVSYRKVSSPQDLCTRLVLIIAAIFFLSPTQFPWYYVWLVPFLALSPRPSLLVLTIMLPLYYLKFYFSARHNVDFFHNRIVWIEYAPVWLLILWEWYATGRREQAAET